MVLTNQPRNQVDVLLPDRPRSAFKWELGTQENQDDPECPEELLENKRHLSPWNPTFNEADVRLRKKMIQQWFNESKKELCDCGCGAAVSLNTDLHNKHNRALTPVTLNRPHIQRTMSTRSVRSATPTNQSRFRRQPLKRSNSVQVVTATDDTDEPHAMPHQTKQWFERVGGSKKNDRETQSLTDLFASMLKPDNKKSKYGNKTYGFGDSLASSMASFGNSMEDLDDDDEDEEKVQVVKFNDGSRTTVGEVVAGFWNRNSDKGRVRFNTSLEIHNMHSRKQYNRKGDRKKFLTVPERFALRDELIRFKLFEMKVHARSRTNTHIFRRKDLGLQEEQ